MHRPFELLEFDGRGVSKRIASPYRPGRRPAHWGKINNPKAPAAKRAAEEDGGQVSES